MDVIDAARNRTSVFPEWCNPSLLEEEAQPLPARSRVNWLDEAMQVWCAGETANAADTLATLSTH